MVPLRQSWVMGLSSHGGDVDHGADSCAVQEQLPDVQQTLSSKREKQTARPLVLMES